MIKNKIKYIALMFMLVFSILFLETKGIDKLIWKTIASTIFTTIGFMHYDNHDHSIWMLVGIFYSFVADVLLELNFIFGAIAFALAHVFFFISYSKIQKINKKDIIYGVSLFIFILIPLMVFVNYIKPTGSTMLIVGIVYYIIISLMTGKSISNYLNDKSNLNKVILIGALLFFISDIFLILNLFGGFKVFRYPNVITYYISMYNLAISINK